MTLRNGHAYATNLVRLLVSLMSKVLVIGSSNIHEYIRVPAMTGAVRSVQNKNRFTVGTDD